MQFERGLGSKFIVCYEQRQQFQSLENCRLGKDVTPRCERHFKYCLSIGTKTIGDEIHFVMVVPQFQEERKLLETKIGDLYLNVSQLNVHNKFIWLLSQEDKCCLNLVVTYSVKCFKLKSEFQI